MQKGQSGNIHWISSATRTWFYELGNWIKELSNSQIEYVESPNYTKKVDVGNFLVDNSKLKSLGWSMNTPIKEGIQKTLDYFKSKNK